MALRAIRYLLTGFTAGAVGLGLEVLAGRTLAPYLGTGSVTWSALLAVALGSLAAGNLMGGWLSERPRPERWLSGMLAGSALALGVLALTQRSAVRWAAGLPLLPGALAAAAITQTVPMLLLGTLSPLLIKAGSGAGSGRWSGAVLAAGSAGGIAGALITGLGLLPTVGITGSFFGFAGILAGGAALQETRGWRWLWWAFGGVMIAAAWWAVQRGQSGIQSPYGQIEVRREGGTRLMLIDGLPQAGIPEAVAPWSGLAHGYLLEAALLAHPDIQRALVIGLGGGLAPRLLAAHGIACECVELDPCVLRVARGDFGLSAEVPVTLADGRVFLERERREWDLIVLDICTAERLAAHCFTVEFMRLIQQRLAPGGVLAIQFIGDRGMWPASVLRTVGAVFGREQTVLLEAGGVGITELAGVSVGPQWILAGRRFPRGGVGFDAVGPEGRRLWREVDFSDQKGGQEGVLLTDDRFPVEREWNRVARLWRQMYAQ